MEKEEEVEHEVNSAEVLRDSHPEEYSGVITPEKLDHEPADGIDEAEEESDAAIEGSLFSEGPFEEDVHGKRQGQGVKLRWVDGGGIGYGLASG